MKQQYGYIRVSTKDQNEQRQLLALTAFGIHPGNIFMDKLSGKNFNRPQYQSLVHHKLKKGDLLVVQSIDRLGRNYDEILDEWRYITKEIGASILILDMPLLDTRSERDLMGMVISDIVLQLLSFVAQKERESIRQRQAEGIAAAKARGVKFGRKSKPIPDSFKPIYEKWKRHEITSRNAQELSGLSKQGFYNLIRKCKEYEGI